MKNPYLLFAVITAAALFSSYSGAPASAQGPDLRIAVSDFTAKGVNGQTAKIVSEWIQNAMSNGPYTVIERSKLSAALEEQELQMAGLSDQDTAVQTGKIISANKILTGSVVKIGSKYVINGRLIDVEKGVSQFGHSEYTWQESDLDACSQRFVDNIILKIGGTYSDAGKAVVPLVGQGFDAGEKREKELVSKTIRTMYDAYINKDIDAYFSVIDNNAHFWCSAYDLRGIDQIRRLRTTKTFVKFSDFEYKLNDFKVSINGNSAEVSDTYTLGFTIVSTGKRITESAKERYGLIKKGNSWYIVENQEF